jgi:hypothetical protein
MTADYVWVAIMLLSASMYGLGLITGIISVLLSLALEKYINKKEANTASGA